MSLSLYNIGKKKKKIKRLGRGTGSGRGTYSTRGQKGQRARSGGRKGLQTKGLRFRLLAIPKMKGMKIRFPKAEVVKLSLLDKHFNNDETVSVESLFNKKLVNRPDGKVKILADKEIKNKLIIAADCFCSEKAKQAIEKAGGSLTPAVEKV